MTQALVDFNRVRIHGPALRRALIAGARRVIAQRDELNRINVFPVPDGDTGSNLAFTLGGVLTGALSRRTASVSDLMRQVGEHAIDGARGNSGAILAQFFVGMSEAMGSRRVLAPSALAEAVVMGALSARQALSDPREGTILSVLTAFADALSVGSMEASDIRAWFSRALETARQALANTPKQLPALMKAGVVDAGARGFVDLLEGIDDFIGSGQVDLSTFADDLAGDLEAAEGHGDMLDADPGHRWCSECLLLGDDLDRQGLRVALAELGASCVVIAGSQARLRLHAHVSEPERLFEIAAHFGRVEATKADDMNAQRRAATGVGGVAIITDSAADLPDGLAESLNIHVVPMRLNFGERDYLDRIGLAPTAFYRMLRDASELPRTSQPSPGDFRRQFEFLLSHHPALVYLGVSRAASGTVQSAESAAARGHSDRTYVFDTANAAGGQALLAISAAQAAQRGDDAGSIMRQLALLRSQTRTWAVARDIRHAVRGGRIPSWATPIVEGLGMTPIANVTPEGRLKLASGLFGRRRVPERFAAYVAKKLDRRKRWRVIVSHCDAQEDGRTLLAAIVNLLDCENAWLAETGPAVGVHAGPGALVLSVQPVS